MNTSFYKLSEQARARIGKGEMQELIEAVRQSFATAVKLLWYEGKKADLSEIAGAYMYTFGKDSSAPLTPVLDSAIDQYYIDLPSTAVSLPHEIEVVNVSYLSGMRTPFVRLPNGALGIYANLKSYHAGGNQMWTIENKRMYFPKMIADSAHNITLTLAVGVDQVDPDEDINIPLNTQDMIVEMVVQKFAPKPTNDQTLNN